MIGAGSAAALEKLWNVALPDQCPRILMLFPDEPLAHSTGGAVRAWQFLKTLAELGSVRACVASVGQDASVVFSETATVMIERVPGGEQCGIPARGLAISRLFSLLLAPWRNRGHQLVLAGHNVCVSRSGTHGFSWLHWCYGAVLLLVFTVLRKLLPQQFDSSDVQIRSNLLNWHLQKLQREKDTYWPDIIWIEHTYMFSVAEQLKALYPNAMLAVNAHNVEGRLKQSIAEQHHTWLGRCWGVQESRLLCAMEQRMMDAANVVACCSESDRRRFDELKTANHQPPGQRLFVAPNGVDTAHFHRLENRRCEKTVIFSGTAGYAPNDDAVAWLLHDIWPLIQQTHSDATLIIAGRNARKCWDSLAQNSSGVQLYSDVDDMRPLLTRAAVAVVPLRSGSGTRLKILEAFSMEITVVSTTIGAEGLEAQHERELLLADCEQQFAAQVCRLLGDPAESLRIASAGRHLAERKYDWELISTAVRTELVAALGDNSAGDVRPDAE